MPKYMRKYVNMTLILCYYENNMNMFQRKSLKLQCKKTTTKKEEMIRLHSDSLRDFQSSIPEFRA